MAESENVQIYQRFIAALGEGRLDVLDEVVDPGVILPTLAPLFETTLAGLRQANEANRAAFSDLRAEIVEVFGSGDWVAARLLWTGTHDGPLAGSPPTGKSVSIAEMEIVQIVDGRIVDLRQVADFDSLQAQLS